MCNRLQGWRLLVTLPAMQVVVHGIAGSSNVQSVLLALAEKRIEYELREQPAALYKRPPYTTELHPFGMVPAFEHGDFTLYETQAIMRYISDAFAGVRLEPESPRSRARMNQIIGIVQSYMQGIVYGGGSINFYRAFAPTVGVAVDHARIEQLLPRARGTLAELDRLHQGPYLTGELSLADLMLAPIMYVFRRTPEGASMIEALPRIAAWIARCESRPSARLLRMPYRPV